jgi:predicted nuclease with TOPRIM domain
MSSTEYITQLHKELSDLVEENAQLRERITALEAKCALLAASWKKAEDELEKMRAALVTTSR